MTFHRVLSAALFAGIVGCAALPNAGGDVCLGTSTNGDCGLVLPDGGAGDANNVAWDGAFGDVGTAAPAPRSNLCAGDCNPEDALACVFDGGVDADAGVESCRVVLGANQQTSSTCGKSGTGSDGDSCTSGADCSAGYECVGTGTCRHYCCYDDPCTTLTHNSNDYSTYFCDIATEHAASGAVVPVCSVVQACLPLKSQQCGTSQACTIVEIDGGKSFVATCDAIGDAKLNDSCETAHCASGYACIGTIGSRTCQQLCDETHPCSGNATCNTQSPALAQFNGTVGICGQ